MILHVSIVHDKIRQAKKPNNKVKRGVIDYVEQRERMTDRVVSFVQ